MAESVSFKAYLKRAGQEPEVRRFGIDAGAASSYVYLRSKIQTIFPSIQSDQFSVFWHDGDDFISIDTDEELVVALTNSVQPIKLHVHVTAQTQSTAGSSFEPQVHAGITCDGCEGGITGFRYKCVTCPDFDLCVKCEGKGLHPEHIMMRMSTPLSPHMRSKFYRKMFGRPHKFMRHHGWNRGGEGCGAPPPPPAGGCPFTRGEEAQSTPGPRVADMFDFSALMDFINTLGVVADEKKPAEPRAQASASAQTSSSAQASTSAQAPPVPGAEYLTNIGQAIQAFLDPFGVNVQFDVRPPKDTAASASNTSATAAATAPTTSSATAPTPSAPTTPVPSAPAAATPTPIYPTLVPAEQTTPVPTAGQVWDAMMRDNYGIPARRNSDDWTLVNRESPARSEEAMAVDVDESRGAVPKTSAKPVTTPESATPASADPESQRVQEAIEKIRAMGFSIDPNILRELLSNQDIATVLEMLLGGNQGKK